MQTKAKNELINKDVSSKFIYHTHTGIHYPKTGWPQNFFQEKEDLRGDFALNLEEFFHKIEKICR